MGMLLLPVLLELGQPKRQKYQEFTASLRLIASLRYMRPGVKNYKTKQDL